MTNVKTLLTGILLLSSYIGFNAHHVQAFPSNVNIENKSVIAEQPLKKVSMQNKKSDMNFIEEKEEKTKKKAEQTTNNNTKKNVERTIQVEATAYTAHCEGCIGITKTGINLLENPDKKVIAVDPNVIPLGTEVYVEGYGRAVAGDIGSAIQGNRIDVFIPSQSDALDFGRRQNVTVEILS